MGLKLLHIIFPLENQQLYTSRLHSGEIKMYEFNLLKERRPNIFGRGDKVESQII